MPFLFTKGNDILAVYTRLDEREIEHILKRYSGALVGKFQGYEGITDGIENTNYLIKTNNDKYILTLLEERTDPNGIPFISEVQESLLSHNFNCPHFLPDHNGNRWSHYQGKTLVMASFVSGKAPPCITPHYCAIAGELLARIHHLASSVKSERASAFCSTELMQYYHRHREIIRDKMSDIWRLIEQHKAELSQIKYNNLPRGVCHLDFFPDNVHFDKEAPTGVIDFYFAATDYYVYDLAITLNAWCYDKHGQLIESYARALTKRYQTIRQLTDTEKLQFKNFMALGALRFLLTRTLDAINQKLPDIEKIKPASEYAQKLKVALNLPDKQVQNLFY